MLDAHRDGRASRIGQTVIVDAVNDAPEARRQWSDLAAERHCDLRFIEVTCSDPATHRRRLESRDRAVAGFAEPTWASVDARRASFEGWDDDHLVLDSMDPLERNLTRALDHLRQRAEGDRAQRAAQ